MPVNRGEHCLSSFRRGWNSPPPRPSDVDYIRYMIEYTPSISGKYSPEISIAGGKLTSEATAGSINIVPAYVGTLVETDEVRGG